MTETQNTTNFPPDIIIWIINEWLIDNTEPFTWLLSEGTLTDLEIAKNLVSATEMNESQRTLILSKISERIEEMGKTHKTRFSETIEFFRDLIVIFVVVLIVRTFIAAPFQISGSSMEESYHDGEFILVNKFSYADFFVAKIGNPVRGDVVILRPHAANGKEYYIKRVVGIPGDTVKFEGGNVFLKVAGKTDFVKLDEGYLSIANKGKTFLPMDVRETEFTVPVGQYFTMGDNRNNSSDSRSCFMSCSVTGSAHFVSRENIVGKLFVDFGYVNIFRDGGVRATGEWKWTHAPRFLDTPKDWVYKELE